MVPEGGKSKRGWENDPDGAPLGSAKVGLAGKDEDVPAGIAAPLLVSICLELRFKSKFKI